MQQTNLYPIRAMKAFARSKPWRGNLRERKKKFTAFHAALQEVYDYRLPLEFAGRLSGEGEEGPHSLASSIGADRRIVLNDKLSVITILFLFSASHFQMGRREGMVWAMGAFKKFFPLSFSRLVEVGGCYFKPGQVPAAMLERFPRADGDGAL